MLSYEEKYLNTADFNGDKNLEKILNKRDAGNVILNT